VPTEDLGFFGCTEFEWDDYNSFKIWDKHRVAISECEEVFFNVPFVTAEDLKHSEGEPRFYCLGHSDAERLLFLVFTVRHTRIRIISARDMSRKERRMYEAL
jgi:uncharacterized DUF497 family protein